VQARHDCVWLVVRLTAIPDKDGTREPNMATENEVSNLLCWLMNGRMTADAKDG
jgi:hypothetical protein